MTVKPLNRGHLLVLKHLSVIKMYLLLAGSLTKIVTFGTKHFVRYSRHVRYLGCPLLGGFTVQQKRQATQPLIHLPTNQSPIIF